MFNRLAKRDTAEFTEAAFFTDSVPPPCTHIIYGPGVCVAEKKIVGPAISMAQDSGGLNRSNLRNHAAEKFAVHKFFKPEIKIMKLFK